MHDLNGVQELGASESGLCVVSMSREDGSSHATVVNGGVLSHPLGGHEVVGFVVRGSARKLQHLRRDGRCAVTFRRSWRWIGIEGPAEVIGPDDPNPQLDDQAVAALLRDVFLAAGGSHDDWDEYDRVMLEERRAAVLIRPERLLGG